MGDFIDMDIGAVCAKINKFDERLKAGLLLITQQVAKRMEDWAKMNAPWTDRTGNARKGLKATGKWEDYINLVVRMSHTVDYGYMLELMHNKNYAVLAPAIDKYRDEFLSEWEQIIKETANRS